MLQSAAEQTPPSPSRLRVALYHRQAPSSGPGHSAAPGRSPGPGEDPAARVGASSPGTPRRRATSSPDCELTLRSPVMTDPTNGRRAAPGPSMAPGRSRRPRRGFGLARPQPGAQDAQPSVRNLACTRRRSPPLCSRRRGSGDGRRGPRALSLPTVEPQPLACSVSHPGGTRSAPVPRAGDATPCTHRHTDPATPTHAFWFRPRGGGAARTQETSPPPSRYVSH